jgi:hypothetical protein
MNALLSSTPLDLHKTKLIISPNVSLLRLSEHTAPISWDYNLLLPNMTPSSDDSEWKLRLPERKSNYPLVRGGDVTSQISPVTYELSHV